MCSSTDSDPGTTRPGIRWRGLYLLIACYGGWLGFLVYIAASN